jgi:hypothetical protein
MLADDPGKLSDQTTREVHHAVAAPQPAPEPGQQEKPDGGNGAPPPRQGEGRMTCARFLEMLRKEARVYAEFAREGVIRRAYDATGILEVGLHRRLLSPAALQWLSVRPPRQVRDLMLLWACADISANGPKIFRPNLDQCLAMEQIAPQISLADYAQPYPLMLVELPEAYQRQRTCPNSGGMPGATHAPTFAAVGFTTEPAPTLWPLIFLSSGEEQIMSSLPGDETLEATIMREYGDSPQVQANSLTKDERLVFAGVVRVVLNSMLFLMEFGCKHQGPANPSHYKHLRELLHLARKRKRHVADAERDLRLAPQLYSLDRDIFLHHVEQRHARQAGDGDGTQRGPHWRRGHWTMQAHGPGRSLRKRMLIKPVWVNLHLLGPDDEPGQTSYRVK